MGLRTLGVVTIWLVASVLMPAPASAQKLYAASVRTIAEGGTPGLGGSLYAVELRNVTTTLVGPIRLNGELPLGITGLAVHPATGIFYGITSSLSRSNPLSLVTVDPATAIARMVGPLKVSGSDIAFNRAGILFTWIPETSQLGVVSLETGNVTPIGNPGPAGPPAGLAIDPVGIAYITPKGATGTIDTVDIGSGAQSTGPTLTGAPFESNINSMTFTPSGLLLAVNSNAGSPAAARLVTINVATGAVSNLGPLPDDTDALAFAPPEAKENEKAIDWRSIALFVLAGVGLVLGFIGWLVGHRAK